MISTLPPYPEMRDSGVAWLGEVPEHWEVRRLKASVRGCINGTWGSDADGRNDLLCVRVADFDRARLRINLSQPTTRAVPVAKRSNRLLANGDLLLEKSGGGDLQPVGAVMLYDHDAQAVCSNFIARMPVSTGYDSQWLSYVHSHLYSIRLNVRSIKQTTGIQNLDSASYLGERIAFAPIGEQRAIALFLDDAERRIQRYIRAKERVIELLAEQKQALIDQAVAGQIDIHTGQPYPVYRDSGVECLEEVPEHWEVRRLGGVGRFFKGNGGTKADETRVGVPCVRYGDLYTQHQFFITESRACIAYDRARAYTNIRYGDLLFAGSGETIEEIGKSAVNLISGKACCGGDVIVFRPTIDLDAKFIGWATDCRLAVSLKAGMGRGITVMHIYTSDLKQLVVPLPPIAEQTAIARFLDDADRLISARRRALEREIELLREFRIRLIADVVTGKLDVREAVADLPVADPNAGGNRGGANHTETNSHATEHGLG